MRVLLPFLKSKNSKSLSDESEEPPSSTKSQPAKEGPPATSTSTKPRVASDQKSTFPLEVTKEANKEQIEDKRGEIEKRKASQEESYSSYSKKLCSLAPPALKTTGLDIESFPSRESSSLSIPSNSRKRPYPKPDSQEPSKVPALERKPAAKPKSATMGLPPLSRGQSASQYLYRSQTDSHQGTSLLASNSLSDDPVLTDCIPTEASYAEPQNEASAFEENLKKRGLEIKEQEGDGNCLFRAVSLQVYGDASMHGQIRKQCLDFMENDREHFSHFITNEDFDDYILRKRQDGVHGNNPEIQAISELFNRPIEVFSPESGAKPLNIFQADYKTDDVPIRLSYHNGNHYNAVIDPLVPTAGLGLGLPGLQPGLADKMQVAKAVVQSDAAADEMALKEALKKSEEDELQRALKESTLTAEHSQSNEAITLSDMDATYFELEQAALEHSLQSHIETEQNKKKSSASTTDDSKKKAHPAPSPSSEAPAVASLACSPVAALPSSEDTMHPGETSQPLHVPPVASIPQQAEATATPFASIPSRDDDCILSKSMKGAIHNSPVVHELVMNGFDQDKVLRAVELIGENFDDLLPFLMANAN